MAGRAHQDIYSDLCRTVYPELLGEARLIARENGCAIGVHGSMLYDLDLIAIPWSGEAVEPNELVNQLLERMTGCLSADAATSKPHGRMAHTLLFHDRLHVDLSIMPPTLKDTANG